VTIAFVVVFVRKLVVVGGWDPVVGGWECGGNGECKTVLITRGKIDCEYLGIHWPSFKYLRCVLETVGW
jgi:hypothetical protein